MKKNEVYTVEELLQYYGDRPSATSVCEDKEVPQKYEGDKTILLIDEMMLECGLTKDDAFLRIINSGNIVSYGERYFDIDHFEEVTDPLTEDSIDVIAYVYTRRCSECGRLMFDGYMVSGESELYCSEECLHKHYTDEEWEQMCEEDDETYWTEWF